MLLIYHFNSFVSIRYILQCFSEYFVYFDDLYEQKYERRLFKSRTLMSADLGLF